MFPFLRDRLPAINEARTGLLDLCAPVYSKARKALVYNLDITFVLYVGIGCGAGWGTSFQSMPAVLFGLEMIAECGWSRPATIAGLIAHEIGHLVHKHWREKHGKTSGSGPWWDLYSEGFAQRCEHIVHGKETWHESVGINDPDWVDWCRKHKAWLAAEFIRTVREGRSVRPFFGSWFDIRGRRQCGYFLGHEMIKELEASATLKEIALIEDAENSTRAVLKEWAT